MSCSRWRDRSGWAYAPSGFESLLEAERVTWIRFGAALCVAGVVAAAGAVVDHGSLLIGYLVGGER